jgi:hypothetical protein
LQTLPAEAQFSPVYAAVAGDYTGDGVPDLLLGGNSSGVTPTYGRYDASYGLLLRGDGAGGFAALEMERSGVDIEGEVRHMRALRGANGDRLIVVARNDTTLQLLRAGRARQASAVASTGRGAGGGARMSAGAGDNHIGEIMATHFGDREVQAAIRRELGRIGADGALLSGFGASGSLALTPAELLAAFRATPDGGGNAAFEAALDAVIAARAKSPPR